MAPKEPTRAQLSSKLSYQQHTPSFLLKLQNRIAGVLDEDGEDEEFEYVGNGREPIPRRPAIPERPVEDPGSADEDNADEKPQVVVLRAGKHLTEWEAENVKRKERGLPPLPDPSAEAAKSQDEESKQDTTTPNPKAPIQGLSFSSSSKAAVKSGKRKALSQPEGEKNGDKGGKNSKTSGKKKAKKESKTLLSFGDDA